MKLNGKMVLVAGVAVLALMAWGAGAAPLAPKPAPIQRDGAAAQAPRLLLVQDTVGGEDGGDAGDGADAGDTGDDGGDGGGDGGDWGDDPGIDPGTDPDPGIDEPPPGDDGGPLDDGGIVDDGVYVDDPDVVIDDFGWGGSGEVLPGDGSEPTEVWIGGDPDFCESCTGAMVDAPELQTMAVDSAAPQTAPQTAPPADRLADQPQTDGAGCGVILRTGRQVCAD
ncbi:MAG: hypothetical protein KBF78_13530 [Fuscovulum sp.]|jgi:hypothetical protein|nr:hypothetical protein [Fuscovulum sp.]